MSWEAAGFVKKGLQCPDGAPLSRGQKLILFVLADYHDTKKRMAWPSVVTIAEEALTSLAQTKRDLAYLEEHFAIERVRDRAGRGANYQYRFVGLDVSVAEVRARLEGAQGEPFFSTHEKGSEEVRKGFKQPAEKGAERAHDERRTKEEPKPTEPEPKPAALPSCDASDLWIKIQSELQNTINGHTFAIWFKPMHGKSYAGDVLTVEIPTFDFGFAFEKYAADLCAAAYACGLPNLTFATAVAPRGKQ